MKILQIIQKPQLRGAEIFACQLSEELTRHGHSVDVAYLFPHKSFDLDHFRLKFIPLGADSRNRFLDLKSYKRLAEIILEGKYDVVQANAGDTVKYAVFSKKLHGWQAPLVYRNANKITAFLNTSLKRIFNKFLLSGVDYVISVSENCRIDLLTFFPRATDKSRTIPIGTYSFDHLAPLHADPKHINVVHIGSFVPEKNQELLIGAFKIFHTTFDNARLWFVGDGPLRKKCETQAEKLGLASSVVFWGYKKEAVQLLKSANMMVMPSLTEGLPGVILEAFSCSVPVIASNVGGIPEVVVDGSTGICVANGTEQQYADAMKKMLDSGFRQKVIVNAKRMVESGYHMDQISAKFLNVYKEIISTTAK